MRLRGLILASGSPRRRDLLQSMGLRFDIISPEADENVTGDVADVVQCLARRKAEAVFRAHPDCVVLGADTLVEINGQTLGKPQDEADAHRMLRLLSSNCHRVHTGVCLLSPGNAPLLRHEETKVFFDTLTDFDIARYVASGEPMDKAGAYAMQGLGAMFVKAIEGSPTNVIGLPLHVVRQALGEIDFAF